MKIQFIYLANTMYQYDEVPRFLELRGVGSSFWFS